MNNLSYSLLRTGNSISSSIAQILEIRDGEIKKLLARISKSLIANLPVK